MKKHYLGLFSFILVLFLIMTAGCGVMIPDQPSSTVPLSTYQAGTNAAYLQGTVDAKTTVVDPQKLKLLVEAMIHSQRQLSTNQVVLHQLQMAILQLLVPVTNEVAAITNIGILEPTPKVEETP